MKENLSGCFFLNTVHITAISHSLLYSYMDDNLILYNYY